MRIVISAPRTRFPDPSERGRTYPAITPSAAKGVLDAIWWHPQITWVVDRIVVLNPIRTETVMQARMKNQTTGQLSIDSVETLTDVAYGIEAHFERTRRWNQPGTDGRPYTEGKVLGIVSRRIRQGRHQAYLGSPEFPAAIEQVEKFPPSHYHGTTMDIKGLPFGHGDVRRVPITDGIIDIREPDARKNRKDRHAQTAKTTQDR